MRTYLFIITYFLPIFWIYFKYRIRFSNIAQNVSISCRLPCAHTILVFTNVWSCSLQCVCGYAAVCYLCI
uniref:Uncharacterized protein n=1 Tax=Ciona savignyi TaxID=51511 RepID=H2YQF8_CIOSA